VQVRGQTRAGCALAALLSTTCTASLRGLGAEGCWLSRDAWRRRRPPAGAGAKAAAPAAESARATHTRRALRAMLPQRPVPPRPRGAAGGLQYFLASAPSKLLLCMVFPWCSDGAAAFDCSKKWVGTPTIRKIILFGRWSMAGNAEAARAPSPVGGQAAPPFCCYSTPGALPGLPEAATMRTSALGESASPPAGSAGRRCRGDGDSWPRPGAAVPTTAR